MNVNIKVIRYRKDKTGEKMIKKFNKLSQNLLREIHWKLLGYRKPSEIRKLAKLRKLKKIKKWKLEAESMSG